MCNQCGCNSIQLASGTQGPPGPAGEDGASGVTIVTRDSTVYTTAGAASYESVWSYTIPINTLVTNGDELWLKIGAKAGDASLGVFDEFKALFNASALTNPTASYIGASSATFRCPYISKEAMTILVKIVRLTATTVRIFLYLEANYGGSRQDLYATSTSCNNLTTSTNSLALELSSADTAGSISVYDIAVYKLLQA